MRLPLASFRTPYQQPRLLCPSTDLTATPFPRKSRHRSDVKRLPQSAFQPQSKSLTRLTTLLPFCRCRVQQRVCQLRQRWKQFFWKLIFLRNPRRSAGLHVSSIHGWARSRSDSCKCLIQRSAGFELKPLGRQTANGLAEVIRLECAAVELSIKPAQDAHFSSAERFQPAVDQKLAPHVRRRNLLRFGDNR